MNSSVLTSPGHFFWSLGRDIIYFPFWWYSNGFLGTVKGVWRFWVRRQESLGLSIWLRNIFVPMYGQRDFGGRLVSFFMRLFQIIVRGLLMLIYFVLGLVVMAVWLLIIPAWVYLLISKF